MAQQEVPARHGRRTPSIAKRRLRRLRDFDEMDGDGRIDGALARHDTAGLGVDAHRFGPLDPCLLAALVDTFAGRRVSRPATYAAPPAAAKPPPGAAKLWPGSLRRRRANARSAADYGGAWRAAARPRSPTGWRRPTSCRSPQHRRRRSAPAPPGGQAGDVWDILGEDIDFRFRWATPADVGHKAAASNLSNVGATMGAAPWALQLMLAVRRWSASAAVLTPVGVVQRQGATQAYLCGAATHRLPPGSWSPR